MTKILKKKFKTIKKNKRKNKTKKLKNQKFIQFIA